MNFMRDNFRTDKKRKISSKDINFFQTVREGTRRYGSKQENPEPSKASSSSSSVVGRTFIRPVRTKAIASELNLGRSELSVLNILEDEFDNQPLPTPLLSSIHNTDGRSFFSSEVNFPVAKRPKTFSGTPFWQFNDGEEITDPAFLPSTSFAPNKNVPQDISENGCANMYIEETAENEYSQFRTNIERLRVEEEDDASRSPEFVPPSRGLESYGLSPPKASAPLLQSVPQSSLGEGIPEDVSHPSSFKTPSGQVSSTGGGYHQRFSPLHHTASSSYNTRKTFFSDITSGTPLRSGGQAKGEAFFKTQGDLYDTMFSTPGRVTALPRITTPQLFIPCQKSTPSKTTPQTKSSGKTPQSVSQDTFYVISITEGRGHAMCEVGVAAIDLNHPVLLLSQFSDSQTYRKTLAKINIIDPAEMLVPDTLKGLTPSVLYKTVTETFPDMRVMTVKRQHYSAKHGLETIRSLLLPDMSSVEMIIHRKYYTLAATEALMKYIEIKHGKLFAPKSLKVNYQSAKDIVSIDLDTCQRLELVMSNAEMVYPEKYSLFGLLNHTKTLGGKRRLRVSLLQPSSSFDVLRERQETITALVNDPRSLQALQTNLLKFSGVERLLWLCLKSPNFKNEARTFETLTNYILLLKASLEAVPHLRKVLQDIDNDYIINIRDELSDNRFDAILARILTMIQEDARPARGYAEAERQRCFAIKDGVNDLLDVARATYSDLIQQVMDNISELGREHGLPLRMVHTSNLGFHPSYLLPKNAPFNNEDLPEIFTEVKLIHRTVHLLTEEIYVYNMRIKRALQEIQLITNVVIYDLVESLREEISFLYRLCEHISDLDFLSCLAQVSSNTDFTKPIFADHTSIVGGRHPILDHVRPTKPIPNNVNASKKKNFNIITGPNMGGKTVYVLMIPLIQIMAQIGCYVPADKAEIRITDHIYVKKGSSDSIECKLSSFMKEVKELTYTITNITDTSLIILDEICTGTLSDEGTAIAWAFCEQFLMKSAYTFLTTHYHYLTNLSKIFRNVTNYNMEAIEKNTDDFNEYCGLTFTYRLLPGVTKDTNYALRLMMESALPESMKKNAIEIVEKMVRKRAALLPLVVPETPNTSGLHGKIDKIEYFMTNLYGLSITDNFTEEMISTLQRMAIEEILSGDEDEIESRGSNPQEVDEPKMSAHVAAKNQEKSRDWDNNGSKELQIEHNTDEEQVSTPVNTNIYSTPCKSSVSISVAKSSISKAESSECDLLRRQDSVVITPLTNSGHSLDTNPIAPRDDSARTNLNVVKPPKSNIIVSSSNITKSKSTPEMYLSPIIQSRKHSKSDKDEEGFRSPLPSSSHMASLWKGAANSVFKTVSLPNIQNLSSYGGDSPRNLTEPATFNPNIPTAPQIIETQSSRPRSGLGIYYVSPNKHSLREPLSEGNTFVMSRPTSYRTAQPGSPKTPQHLTSASVSTHIRNQYSVTRHPVNISNSPKAVSQPNLPFVSTLHSPGARSEPNLPLLHNRKTPVSKNIMTKQIPTRILDVHSSVSESRNSNIGSDYFSVPSSPRSTSPVSFRTQHSGGGPLIPRSSPSSRYSANPINSKGGKEALSEDPYNNPVPSTSSSYYTGNMHFSSSNDSSGSK